MVEAVSPPGAQPQAQPQSQSEPEAPEPEAPEPVAPEPVASQPQPVVPVPPAVPPRRGAHPLSHAATHISTALTAKSRYSPHNPSTPIPTPIQALLLPLTPTPNPQSIPRYRPLLSPIPILLSKIKSPIPNSFSLTRTVNSFYYYSLSHSSLHILLSLIKTLVTVIRHRCFCLALCHPMPYTSYIKIVWNM